MQSLIHDSADEVDEMIKMVRDPAELVTYIAVMKRYFLFGHIIFVVSYLPVSIMMRCNCYVSQRNENQLYKKERAQG